MQTAIVVGLFFAIAAAVFTLSLAALAPASVLAYRIQWLLGRRIEARQKPDTRERFEEILDPLSKMAPKSPEDVSRVRAQLIQAGYRETRHAQMYYGIRVLLALLALLVVAASGLLLRSPILALAAAAVGYMLPRFILKRMISRRQLAIQLAMPDALDLAVICVEAGLGLDQAVSRVGQELSYLHPELSDEFHLVNLEMRAGKPRADALRNLALRTGVDDVRAFVAVLIQTDRFGTSIANALRVHSDALRTERRQRAEERAAKTTIKMVPVLVFFIFPAMFIVVLGPAIIGLLRQVVPVVTK
jgi:tight adherence protein C